MPAWIPIATVVLPVLASIAEKAIPAFTTRKHHAKSLEEHSAQIAELQAAATQNATTVRELAEQMRKAVRAIDDGAAAVERQLRILEVRLRWSQGLAIAAIVVAALAVVGAGAVFLR